MTCYHSHIPKKAVCIPGSEPVDISDYEPLIDHPLCQRMRRHKQLGINHLVFPGAVHSRFEHALGVLGLTEKLARLYGMDENRRKLLGAFAILHDIGHGPFSHQIEPIAGGSHKTKGLDYIKRMAPTIEACGLKAEDIMDMFSEKNRLAIFVNDRNLGMDKLDYLRRDALHIGFAGVPDIETVLRYSALKDGQWTVEEKFIEDLKRIQKFYSYLHQHGYLNKTALSVQRIFQRAVQEEIEFGTVTKEELWEMTDEELEYLIYRSENELTRELCQVLENRSFHRTAYVIRPQGYGFVERTSGKQIAVKEWTMSKIADFSNSFSNCESLRKMENELADFLALNAGDILFAAMPYFDKLLPRDIRIFSASGGKEYMLFENDTTHYQSLLADYLRTFAIRIIVPPAKRSYVADKIDRVETFLAARLT
ncbi:MAG: HD domain-containing protein [Lentisphaeria bacterium]